MAQQVPDDLEVQSAGDRVGSANACLMSCDRKSEMPASFVRLRRAPCALSHRPGFRDLKTRSSFNVCVRQSDRTEILFAPAGAK